MVSLVNNQHASPFDLPWALMRGTLDPFLGAENRHAGSPLHTRQEGCSAWAAARRQRSRPTANQLVDKVKTRGRHQSPELTGRKVLRARTPAGRQVQPGFSRSSAPQKRSPARWRGHSLLTARGAVLTEELDEERLLALAVILLPSADGGDDAIKKHNTFGIFVGYEIDVTDLSGEDMELDEIKPELKSARQTRSRPSAK